MPNDSNQVQPKQSNLTKTSRQIIQDFHLNDTKKIRKTLLQLVLDFYAIAPDDLVPEEFRDEINQMYWSIETLLDNIEKYRNEISYEIERRVG